MQPQVLGAGQTRRDDLPGPFRDRASAPTMPTMPAAAVVTFPLEGSSHVSLGSSISASRKPRAPYHALRFGAVPEQPCVLASTSGLMRACYAFLFAQRLYM